MISSIRLALWGAVLFVAAVCAIAALRLFPQALPMLDLDVRMSREAALAAAARLAQERFPELATDREAIRFRQDGQLQTYVELEGGGLAAYRSLLGSDFAPTHAWVVRRFAEAQEDELSVSFSPGGALLGFARRIPEGAPGPALAPAAARAVAERAAAALLGPRWSGYVPYAASQVMRPGGRVDHEFIYEYAGVTRGEARFRLRLVVRGERLTELQPFAFIPEGFDQRFAQLRDVNAVIGSVAGIAAGGLLGLGGVLGGGLWLARRRAIAWRPALLCGAVVGGLLGAAQLANLPAAWSFYATTDTAQTFLLRHVANAAMMAVGSTLGLSMICAVAEGLGRRAFAGQPLLFRAWSPAAAASPALLGRTLGGYAWTGFELLYVVGFYLVVRSTLGWWVPAESLSDPNILSSWRPALAPIAQALQAGTMEEALFRAVPLAAATLIGRHIGWPRATVALALVLQALVFAGAHATYPGLPGYSRLVELFVPALLWGLFYLRFGLIPSMVTHFLFDLTLMSLPIFVADDPALWFDRLLVIAAGLAPLVPLLIGWQRQRGLRELPAALRSAAPADGVAQGATTAATASTAASAMSPPGTPSRTPSNDRLPGWLAGRWPLLIALLSGGVLGVLPATPIKTPAFSASRAEVIAAAETAVAARGVTLGAEWQRTAVTAGPDGGEDGILYAWREAGAATVQRLVGKGIDPPHWEVVFRRFDGPVEDRAEKWLVQVDGGGTVFQVNHRLPESRAGAMLERPAAEALARRAIAADGRLANRPWKLTEVRQDEHPSRRDWEFDFDDTATLAVPGGAARLVVWVAGDEVTYGQTIFVPDAWRRTHQEARSAKTPYRIVGSIAGALLSLLVLGLVLRHVVSAHLPWRTVAAWAALALAVGLGEQLLHADRIVANFDTAREFTPQAVIALASMLLGQVVGAVFVGAMVATLGARAGRIAPGHADLLRGAALTMLLGAGWALANEFLPRDNATFESVQIWTSRLPLASAALGGVSGTLLAVAVLGALSVTLEWCEGTRRRGVVGALAAIGVGAAALAAETPADSIKLVLLVVVGAGVQVWLVQRQRMAIALSALALVNLADLPPALAAGRPQLIALVVAHLAVALGLLAWLLRRRGPWRASSGGPRG